MATARKAKPIISIPIASKHKYEWATREEGSYEDSKRNEDHVFNVLSRKPHTRIQAFNESELNELIRSAGYCSDTRDAGNEDGVKAERAIAKVRKQLISFQNSQ